MSQNAELSFERDIKPLFREMDRQAMEGAFDLWDHGDVSEHAGPIYEAVAGGGMPCDAPWPPERVALLKRWVDLGMPE